jgi:hypothetical protein
VCDLLKGCENVPDLFRPVRRHSPDDHGVAGYPGSLMPEDGAEFPDHTLLRQCPDRIEDRLLVHPRPGGDGAEGPFFDGEIALQLPEEIMPTVIFEMIHDLIDLPPTTEGKRVQR